MVAVNISQRERKRESSGWTKTTVCYPLTLNVWCVGQMIPVEAHRVSGRDKANDQTGAD